MKDRKAKTKFSEYLQANGLKGSQPRNLILDVFLSMPPHLTAEELHRKVARRDANVGLSTVYRTLRLFCEAGIAKQRHFQEGVSRFEQAIDIDHHDHLICVECGAIIEFECQEIEDLQETVAEQHGFTLRHHRLELFGVCGACRAAAEGGVEGAA